MNFNQRASQFSDWCRVNLLYYYIAPHWLEYRLKRFSSFYWPAFWRTPTAARKGWLHILRDLLVFRGGLIPYFHYGLYRRGTDRRSFGEYIDETWFYYRVCYGRGRNHILLDDKVLFGQVCAALNLPAARTLLFTKQGTVRSPQAQIISTDSDVQLALANASDSLIRKPAVGSSGGLGIYRYRRRQGDGVFVSSIGTLDYSALAKASRDGDDVLIQEELRNHAAFLSLGANALLCLRVMSVFGKGRVDVPCALLKLAVEDGVVDNGRAGGIYIAVDLRTGRLAAEGVNERLERFTESPSSNTSFGEFVVPHIEEVVSLTRRAAAAFSDLPTIGWDIAVTSEGPVIVEGNSSPSLAMVMKSHHGAAALRGSLAELL